MRFLKKLFLTTWSFCAIWIVVLSVVTLPVLWHYLTWPAAQGEIVGSDILVSDDNATFGYTHKVIEISYDVPGDDMPHFAWQQVLFSIGHREGKKVTVHYNPENYDEIVDPLVMRMFFPILLFLWIFEIAEIKKGIQKLRLNRKSD